MTQVSQCLWLVGRPGLGSPEKEWVAVGCGTAVGCDPGESLFVVG